MLKSPEKLISASLDELARETATGGLSGIHILAAVSGGADSVALLCLLHRLSDRYGYTLSALTVNHLIRSPEESGGDSRFVADLCASLDPPVSCHLVDLRGGEVEEFAAFRGRGIEEAAREIRYRHFDETADTIHASYIMTGHTRNDQAETILMRFLQGSGGAALGGISRRRGRYVRPMLEVERPDIVAWLRGQGIAWREDSSNEDMSFLRNRIRHRLVPVLNSIMPGWESGAAAAAEKALLDDDLCRHMLPAVWKRSGGRVECLAEDFTRLHPALRLRFLQNALNLLSVDHRVPFGFLKRVMGAPEYWNESGTKNLRVCGSGLSFDKEGNSVFLGPDIVHNGKSGYLVHIYSCGSYCFPFGTITVTGDEGAVFLDGFLGPFKLPLTIRSRLAGDSIRTADGKMKTVKKLMNDWSIPESDRNLLPVVEQAGTLSAVYGSTLGYPDRVVHI
jgi:tRNA(Ile)-lysidine synthase